MKGVVLSGTGGVWQVHSPGRGVVSATLRGRVKNASSLKLAVGDEVVLERAADGATYAIGEIAPRRSRLARREPGARYGERVIAANIDQVIVVFAVARPEPHARMLDRFLVVAEANELRPRIVANKIELPDGDRHVFDAYVEAGYPLHLTSVKSGIGLDDLRTVMSGRSSVFTGPSGVGKSSLLNAMYPGLNLRIGEVSEAVGKGRHTTVGASMHALPEGGYVIDTPGLREVGLWGLPADELARCFREFTPYLSECRFGDCTHVAEPGCAVRGAVASGAVTAARHESYVKLRAEVEEAEHSRMPHGRPARK